MVFGAQDAHFELTDRNKAVVIPVFEINKAHRGALFVRFSGFADAGVFKQQAQDMAVILDKSGSGVIMKILYTSELIY